VIADTAGKLSRAEHVSVYAHFDDDARGRAV